MQLSESDRTAALIISKALKEPTRMLDILATEPAFKLDYAEIIDESSFELANTTTQKKRAIIAGWVNGVRLLDNAVVDVNS
jgi:pantoate--beta-alanine ligase